MTRDRYARLANTARLQARLAYRLRPRPSHDTGVSIIRRRRRHAGARLASFSGHSRHTAVLIAPRPCTTSALPRDAARPSIHEAHDAYRTRAAAARRARFSITRAMMMSFDDFRLARLFRRHCYARGAHAMAALALFSNGRCGASFRRRR